MKGWLGAGMALVVAAACAAEEPGTGTAAEPAQGEAPAVQPTGGAAPDSAHDVVQDTADSRWTAGDTDERRAVAGTAVLRAVRTARHDDFDRIVYEFGSAVPGYRISYIDRPVRQCGSGDVVPFAGDAWLSMVFEPSDAHTEEGQPTIMERARTLNLPNIIELKLICDFEAQVEWVAGVHSPMEYRVLTLEDPARIVVDIRHHQPRRKPGEVYP